MIPEKEPTAVNISEEGKEVFKKSCLIGLGIPAVLTTFILAIHFSPWGPEPGTAPAGTLNAVMAGLIVAGLAMWAFFSQLLYRRLWKIFPHIGDVEKCWSFAQGVFGLLGVGACMSSVLAVFYYLFTGDLGRSMVLCGLAFALTVVEMLRFPGRIADVEDVIAGMG